MSQSSPVSVNAFTHGPTGTSRSEARTGDATRPIDQAPFLWTARDKHSVPVELLGQLPSWLRGDLLRTAPAVFKTRDWSAEHWFDGLGIIYGFDIDASAAEPVRYKQRQLASHYAQSVERGRPKIAAFGTKQHRSFVQRLFEPIPETTDNANVNILPWQGAWLAMTETPHQHVLDGETLASQGLYRYQDDLPSGLSMTAHPHYDFVGNAMLNVGIRYGRKPALLVLRQAPHERSRTVEAKLPFQRLPYVHDFGVTERSVVLMDHPLRVNPVSMLFSDRPLIEHFKWEPEQGTRLWRLDRRSGAWQSFETDTFFCFHIVNTFEDGEDTVFDFVAFDDPTVVWALRVQSLGAPRVPLQARYVRARLSPQQTRAKLETLSSQGFEFPNVAYRREHGRPYQVAWGAALGEAQGRWHSTIVRIDHVRDTVQRFSEPGIVYGEPVFVPKPDATRATEGVVLSVGSHLAGERASLAVLDADSLEPLARADVALALPMGFHGTFKSR